MIDSIFSSRFYVRFKNRNPDPGVCIVQSIDWEARRLTVTNGCCRYYPSFDEVDICDLQPYPHP